MSDDSPAHQLKGKNISGFWKLTLGFVLIIIIFYVSKVKGHKGDKRPQLQEWWSNSIIMYIN